MKKWNIVVDSSCDLRTNYFDEILQNEDIAFNIVPLKVLVGENEYVDNDSVDTDKLLENMKTEKSASSTACPSPFEFSEAYKNGENTICITMTSALSGTYNSACAGKHMLLEEYPNLNVHIVDSKSTCGVFLLAIEKLIELIKSGLDFNEVTKEIDEYVAGLRLTFSLASYDNLVKTGRISHLKGLLAGHLGIISIARKSDEGTIDVLKKIRGEKKLVPTMLEIMANEKPLAGLPVVITHCKNEILANNIKESLLNDFKVKSVVIQKCKALTTFYTMEKGVIVVY